MNKQVASWQALVTDPARLDGLVEGMAKSMAKLLLLRNPEIQENKLALGRALYDEKERFPTPAQLDELEELQSAFQFVFGTVQLLRAMRQDADKHQNVVLSPYMTHRAFRDSWEFTRPRRRRISKIKVGGVCGALYLDAVQLVYNWLLECDRAMCHAFDDIGDGVEFSQVQPTSVVASLARQLAESTARRLTLLPSPDWQLPSEGDEHLSTNALQRRADAEAHRTLLWAEESKRSDLIALRAFELLAKEGARSPRGRNILETQLLYIRYVATSPPTELGLRGANGSRMNLGLLSRACSSEMDIDVRCGIAQQWHTCHGACAATAAQQAIQKINLLTREQRKPFIQVLQPPPVTPGVVDGHTGIPMPAMPFVHGDHVWRFVPTAERRTGLDWTGRRVVRLTSLMMQLLGHGALEKGVIASGVVLPVTIEANEEARCVLNLLQIKRDSYALGTNLLKFCEDVNNLESPIADDVGDALIYVSHFSTLELTSIFHSQSPALRLIMDEFTLRTRGEMMNSKTPCIPAEYMAFAYDAMAILLPLIEHRRSLSGRLPTQRVNPVVELLKRLEVVRSWHPLKGALKLSLKDLEQGSPLLKPVLLKLQAQGMLVSYKRPYLGNQKREAKKAFVFDTVQLVQLLGTMSVSAEECVRPKNK